MKMCRHRGFTLLEVMVALLIAAIMVVLVNQIVHQRINSREAAQQHLLASFCARELRARFEVEGYWPSAGPQQGQLTQGGQPCFWRLSLTDTGVKQLRRGDLQLFADAQGQQALGQFIFFIGRQP